MRKIKLICRVVLNPPLPIFGQHAVLQMKGTGIHLLLHHSQPTPYLIPNLEYELQALLRLAATSARTCYMKY